ncbi:hypothetical protein [Fulvivirga imtechensis]|nr:hypothetical protein [Fulvivirga imtechensis]
MKDLFNEDQHLVQELTQQELQMTNGGEDGDAAYWMGKHVGATLATGGLGVNPVGYLIYMFN